MMAYQYPQDHRQDPFSSVSPLDALQKHTRKVRKDSLRLARGKDGRGTERYPAGSEGHAAWGQLGHQQDRRPELAAGGKGKGKAVENFYDAGQEGDTEGAYGGTEDDRPGTPSGLVQHDEGDQFADAASPRQPVYVHHPSQSASNLSPLRQHKFQASVSTLRTEGMASTHNSDYSDQGESPIVPHHPTSGPGSISSINDIRPYSNPSSPTPPINPLVAPNRGPLYQAHSSHVRTDPEDETESLQADRLTWRSDEEQRWRNSHQEGYGMPNAGGVRQVQGSMPRESNLSSLTMESTGGDPFHYSVYESLPSPSKSGGFQADTAAPLPSDAPPPSTPSQPLPPIVRIGPPSPGNVDDDLPNPHDSYLWTDDSPRQSPSLQSSSPYLGHSPRTPETSPSIQSSPQLQQLSTTNASGGRARSQTIAKNFSRPFSAGADSLDSYEEDNTAQLSSSLGHSSQGAHSLSASWEGRQEMEMRYQQAAMTGQASSKDAQRGPAIPVMSRTSDSPAPFSSYANPATDNPTSSNSSTPISFYNDDKYRVDSYYATSGPPPDLTQGPAVPIHPLSTRNVLKKPQRAPRSSEDASGRWSLFRSSRKSRGADSDPRLSGSSVATTMMADTPVITFTEHLPPPLQGSMNPDEMVRNVLAKEQHYLEQQRYLKLSPRSAAEEGDSWRPSPREEDQAMEQLEDQLGATGMRRGYSDVGPRPQRLDNKATGTADDRPHSSHSLYSNYSFYAPEDLAGLSRSAGSSAQPSPSHSPRLPSAPMFTGASGGQSRGPPNTTLSKAKKAGLTPGHASVLPSHPQTADDFLQLGIVCHENDEMERAAWYFEQSAKKDGGCGTGMLMYGLTLRHGWGCQVNHELGFRFLQASAESVVKDLDHLVAGAREMSEAESNTKAVKNELVLALHELGISYRFGWGCPKDKKMAVAYFQLAADLGDPDAQNDLAFCYANGKGTKKDMKKAAKYYRLAVSQGAESFGLSWIYKDKYVD